jgi:hypothetical protein
MPNLVKVRMGKVSLNKIKFVVSVCSQAYNQFVVGLGNYPLTPGYPEMGENSETFVKKRLELGT